MTLNTLASIPKKGYAKIIISLCPIETQKLLHKQKIKDSELIFIISKNHNILIKQNQRLFLISEDIAKKIITIQFSSNQF